MINKITEQILENPYFVCNYLFLRGSYACNTNNNTSDMDFLVVSRDFTSVSILKRKDLFNKAILGLEVKVTIDVICLSEEEYFQYINSRRNMLFNERMIRLI